MRSMYPIRQGLDDKQVDCNVMLVILVISVAVAMLTLLLRVALS